MSAESFDPPNGDGLRLGGSRQDVLNSIITCLRKAEQNPKDIDLPILLSQITKYVSKSLEYTQSGKLELDVGRNDWQIWTKYKKALSDFHLGPAKDLRASIIGDYERLNDLTRKGAESLFDEDFSKLARQIFDLTPHPPASVDRKYWYNIAPHVFTIPESLRAIDKINQLHQEYQWLTHNARTTKQLWLFVWRVLKHMWKLHCLEEQAWPRAVAAAVSELEKPFLDEHSGSFNNMNRTSEILHYDLAQELVADFAARCYRTHSELQQLGFVTAGKLDGDSKACLHAFLHGQKELTIKTIQVLRTTAARFHAIALYEGQEGTLLADHEELVDEEFPPVCKNIYTLPTAIPRKSGHDYVWYDMPDTRLREVAEHRRIDRDMKEPGIQSDGLRPSELINLPPRHARRPGQVSRWLRFSPWFGPISASWRLCRHLVRGGKVTRPRSKFPAHVTRRHFPKRQIGDTGITHTHNKVLNDLRRGVNRRCGTADHLRRMQKAQALLPKVKLRGGGFPDSQDAPDEDTYLSSVVYGGSSPQDLQEGSPNAGRQSSRGEQSPRSNSGRRSTGEATNGDDGSVQLRKQPQDTEKTISEGTGPVDFGIYDDHVSSDQPIGPGIVDVVSNMERTSRRPSGSRTSFGSVSNNENSRVLQEVFPPPQKCHPCPVYNGEYHHACSQACNGDSEVAMESVEHYREPMNLPIDETASASEHAQLMEGDVAAVCSGQDKERVLNEAQLHVRLRRIFKTAMVALAGAANYGPLRSLSLPWEQFMVPKSILHGHATSIERYNALRDALDAATDEESTSAASADLHQYITDLIELHYARNTVIGPEESSRRFGQVEQLRTHAQYRIEALRLQKVLYKLAELFGEADGVSGEPYIRYSHVDHHDHLRLANDHLLLIRRGLGQRITAAECDGQPLWKDYRAWGLPPNRDFHAAISRTAQHGVAPIIKFFESGNSDLEVNTTMLQELLASLRDILYDEGDEEDSGKGRSQNNTPGPAPEGRQEGKRKASNEARDPNQVKRTSPKTVSPGAKSATILPKAQDYEKFMYLDEVKKEIEHRGIAMSGKSKKADLVQLLVQADVAGKTGLGVMRCWRKLSGREAGQGARPGGYQLPSAEEIKEKFGDRLV